MTGGVEVPDDLLGLDRDTLEFLIDELEAERTMDGAEMHRLRACLAESESKRAALSVELETVSLANDQHFKAMNELSVELDRATEQRDRAEANAEELQLKLNGALMLVRLGEPELQGLLLAKRLADADLAIELDNERGGRPFTNAEVEASIALGLNRRAAMYRYRSYVEGDDLGDH